MPLKQLTPLLLLLLLIACGDNKQRTTTAEGPSDLKLHIDSLGIDRTTLEIQIDKSDRTLAITHKDTVIKTYRMVLGHNPVDDKRMEGDMSTPEGTFKVRDHYPHKRWSKFIWIDYPTEASWVKHNRSKEIGEIPEDATIGGEIGIHGVPEGSEYLIAEGVDWTAGCISLSNQDIDELYTVVSIGMGITIGP